MKIVLAIYNSKRDGQCLATAVINNTQVLSLTNGRTFGTHHGNHPGNEHHVNPDEIELTHAFSVLATTGIVAGLPNDFISQEAFDVNGRAPAPSPAPCDGRISRRPRWSSCPIT